MPINQMSQKESKALYPLEQALTPKFKTTFPGKIMAPLNYFQRKVCIVHGKYNICVQLIACIQGAVVEKLKWNPSRNFVERSPPQFCNVRESATTI